MKLSFTLDGALGDFIYQYLGFPGSKVAYLLKIHDIELRLRGNSAGSQDLLFNNPFFEKCIAVQEEIALESSFLKNDIRFLENIKNCPDFVPDLWLDQAEKDLLNGIKRPYITFHPFASKPDRDISKNFDSTYLAQYVADTSDCPVIVLGSESINYESKNVKQISCSIRCALQIIRNSTFFFGSHSSLYCGALAFNVPLMVLAPELILLHNLYRQDKYADETFLKPLFRKNSLLVFFRQMNHFGYFLDYFLKNCTSLKAHKSPQEYLGRLALLSTVSEDLWTLDTYNSYNKDHNPNFLL